MAWPRVGQGGRSGTSAIRTAPPWTASTKVMNEQKETAKIADGKTTFAQYVCYEEWIAWKQKNENDSHAAADGRIDSNKKMPGVAATTTTERPAMPATK